jgi:hypothetical protein
MSGCLLDARADLMGLDELGRRIGQCSKEGALHIRVECPC